MACPNLSNTDVAKQFTELKEAIGERMAYFIWDKVGNVKEVEGFDKLETKYGTNKALILASNRVIDAVNKQSKPSGISPDDLSQELSQPIDNTGKEIDKKIEIINKDINNILNSFDKSQIKITFATNKTLLDTSDPSEAKIKQDKIKNKYKELKELISCIWP